MRSPESIDAPAGASPTAAPVAPATPGPARRRTALRALLMLGVPLALAAGALAAWLQGGRWIETDNAFLKADKVPVGAEVAGIVRAVLVRENQTVAAGTPLLRLDDAPFRVAVARAEARVAQALTDVAAMRAGYRAKQAEIALARTRHAFAQRDQERQADLAARNFISASRLDEARQATDLAGQHIGAVEQELIRIAESLGGGPDVPAERHPAVLAARAELMQARLDQARIEVRAPVAGTVSRPPKPGQYLAVGATALALVADGLPWVEANFTETELTWIRTGQTALVRIDTYPDRTWRGVVDSVSPATGAEFSVLPPQNATGNWVRIAQRVPVRIHLDAQPDAPPLRAGLSARVAVDTGRSRSLGDLLR
jgi:membrane fusion protein (multidrug efflux system)